MTYRNRKYLDQFKNAYCVSCGVESPSVVAAHYQGPRGYAFGKGTGTKPSDAAVAALCAPCHVKMDQYLTNATPVERSEEFLYYIVKTYEMMLENELIKVG